MACASCSPGEFMATRRDAFKAAHVMLRDLGPKEDDDEEPVSYSVSEVLQLARFLIGEDE